MLGYLAVLAFPGAPCVPLLSGQLCAVLCVADGAGEGVAAVTAVVPVDVDVDEDVCVVAAPATAMLAPNPTPSAPAPIAVPIMNLPSLVFNVSASCGRVMVLPSGHPRRLRTFCSDALPTV